jgi:DNA polymerase-4
MGMRKIVHLDLDAFYCAVEERNNPSLAGKCFAVGGAADRRGVVSSCSYAARQKGVRSAMPMAKAMRLCPELIRVSGSHSNYHRASRHVMSVLRRFSEIIQQISVDEAFMDVSDTSETMALIGKKIQDSVNRETHLPCSLGIATNKLVAKIANDFGKSQYRGNRYPNALTVIEPGREQDFLAPLPMRSLWGVGPKTAESLKTKGLDVIGDLVKESDMQLMEWFGTGGPHLKRYAMGIDDRPVAHQPAKNKSISNETTFATDITQTAILETSIKRIGRNLGIRLKRSNLRGSVVRIKFRWADFSTFTRQVTITPTDDGEVIGHVGVELLHKNWDQEKAIRLIGVAISNLVNKADQLSLWDQEVEKNQDVFEAISRLEERFGPDVVKKASALKMDEK